MALIPFYRPDFSRVIMNLDGPLQGRVEKTDELPPPSETAPLPLPEYQPAPDIDPIPPPTDYPPTSSPEHSSPPRGTLHGNVMESIGQVVGAALQAVLGGSIGSANDILLPSNGVLPNDFLSELDEVPTPPIGNGYPRRQPFSNNIQPNLVNNFRLASNVTPVELPEGITQNFSGEGLAGVIANNAVFQHQEDHPAPVWDFQAIDQRSQTLPVQNQAQQRDNFIQAQPSLHRHVPMSQGAIPVSFRSAAQQRINEINQSIRGRLDEMTAQRQHQEMLEAIRANANYRDGSRRGNAFNDVQRGEPLTPKAQQALAHATMVADAAAKKAAADQQKQREFARLKQQHFKALEASKIGLQVNELVDEHGSPIQTTKQLNSRPLGESSALHQRIMGTNKAQQQYSPQGKEERGAVIDSKTAQEIERLSQKFGMPTYLYAMKLGGLSYADTILHDVENKLHNTQEALGFPKQTPSPWRELSEDERKVVDLHPKYYDLGRALMEKALLKPPIELNFWEKFLYQSTVREFFDFPKNLPKKEREDNS